MLDSRFRLQRISQKHTLHLCKATLTVCTPKLQLFIEQSVFSEMLIHVVFKFLESFIKWFADCSHCNKEGPFPTKKTCLVSMIWSHLQQTLRVDQTCYWCCRLWCRLLSTTASCSSWPTAGQLDQFGNKHEVTSLAPSAVPSGVPSCPRSLPSSLSVSTVVLGAALCVCTLPCL